jgi:fructose-specific phosphotransferase system IIC component
MLGYQKKGLISRIFDVQKDFPFGDVFVINLQQH